MFAAYDGPQSYDLNNPDSTTTKVQVLQVTSGHSKTEDDDSDDDEYDDIPTISTGTSPRHHCCVFRRKKTRGHRQKKCIVPNSNVHYNASGTFLVTKTSGSREVM